MGTKEDPQLGSHGRRPPCQRASNRQNLAFAPCHSPQNDEEPWLRTRKIRWEKGPVPTMAAQAWEVEQELGDLGVLERVHYVFCPSPPNTKVPNWGEA